MTHPDESAIDYSAESTKFLQCCAKNYLTTAQVDRAGLSSQMLGGLLPMLPSKSAKYNFRSKENF
jgi:hypothetical protein